MDPHEASGDRAAVARQQRGRHRRNAPAWAPKAFAAQYRVEVYSNDDPAFSPVNRVLQAVTRQPALSLAEFLKPSSTAYRWRVAGDRRQRAGHRLVGGREVLRRYRRPDNHGAHGDGIPKAQDALLRVEPRWSSRRLASRDPNRRGRPALDVVTAASAFAPTDGMADGNYQWRVTAT